MDNDTVVMVADPNTGNIRNFNVGQNVDLTVPRSFWSRLAGRFGSTFYWKGACTRFFRGGGGAKLSIVCVRGFC